MTTVAASVSLANSTVRALASVPDDIPRALRQLPPEVLSRGLKLAGGDVHRLTTDGDGSVIVWNYRVW